MWFVSRLRDSMVTLCSLLNGFCCIITYGRTQFGSLMVCQQNCVPKIATNFPICRTFIFNLKISSWFFYTGLGCPFDIAILHVLDVSLCWWYTIITLNSSIISPKFKFNCCTTCFIIIVHLSHLLFSCPALPWKWCTTFGQEQSLFCSLQF